MSKISILSLAGALATSLVALAEPLNRANIAADAKWVLHLDWDAFRVSSIGKHLVEKVLKPKIDEAKKGKDLDLSVNLENISGLTVYGSSFEKKADGVLMFSTRANIKKDFEKLAGLAALSGNESLEITLEQENPFLLYRFKDDLLIAPDVAGKVLVARSREQLEASRNVVLGKAQSLDKKSAFTDYPEVKDSFFFLGVADGFSVKEVPPQAKVLRETDGGRLVLGEKQQNLFVNLVFKGKDETAALKIKQVLQGIVALASLSDQNQELTDLASRLNIASEGKNVSVDLNLPIATAIKKIDDKHGIRHHAEETDEETSSQN